MALVKFQGGWDIHGDHQDKRANKVFFDFADHWKPKIRICGGDLWNFSCIRSGAKEHEKRESLRDDFKAGKDWFNRFKPTVTVWGNHDNRLWQTAEHGTGMVQDFALEMIAEVDAMTRFHHCQTIAYNKRLVYELGDHKVFHGFVSGVGAARKLALVFGSCLSGHVHAIDQCAAPGLTPRIARIVGCLCALDQPYNSTQVETLRQAHGFPYGFLNEKTGRVQVWQAQEVDGQWLFPSEFFSL